MHLLLWFAYSWSLKYGEHIASALTVASTSLVHLTYRDIFRIRGARTFIGLLPTFVLGTLIPSVCCAILLNNMHMLPMLGGTRREANECPLCGELKANASMFAIGAVFPTFISWSMCMFQAEALKSYTVPPVIDIMKSVRGYFRRVGRLFAHTNKRVYPLVLATSGAYFVMCGGLMAVQRYQYERYIEPLEFTKAEIIAVRMSKGQEV